MTITAEQVEREKRTLPAGWGRFGKTIEHLQELSQQDESLLASCVALDPDYHYKPRFVPGSAIASEHPLHELTTNVVLACTNQRVIMVEAGGEGAPGEHVTIPYAGLEVISRGTKEFVLGMPEGEVRVRGAAKQQVPQFLEALESQAQPG